MLISFDKNTQKFPSKLSTFELRDTETDQLLSTFELDLGDAINNIKPKEHDCIIQKNLESISDPTDERS